MVTAVGWGGVCSEGSSSTSALVSVESNVCSDNAFVSVKKVLNCPHCAAVPLNPFMFQTIKKGIVRAKHFHANITIFEEDNQSCLFCFTAFALSAIQVFIMKQDGV